jgi:hypothetical protein
MQILFCVQCKKAIITIKQAQRRSEACVLWFVCERKRERDKHRKIYSVYYILITDLVRRIPERTRAAPYI